MFAPAALLVVRVWHGAEMLCQCLKGTSLAEGNFTHKASRSHCMSDIACYLRMDSHSFDYDLAGLETTNMISIKNA